VIPRRATSTIWPWLVIAGVLGFLYAPVAITAIFSFNDSAITGFPIKGITTEWYANLWNDAEFREATMFSLKIAALSTLISVLIGTPAAIAVNRSGSRWVRALNAVYVSPMLIPALVLAVSMTTMFTLLSVQLSMWTIVGGHVVVSAPLIFLIVSARLRGFDWTLPSAARVLGATPFQAFVRVTVPLLAPAVMGGAILAFIVSMDNFVISLFLTGGESTLPLLIWSRMRESFDPTVNAMATLLLVATLTAAIVAERLTRARTLR
jgi:spermidine/putrescine transport system permease protein